MENDLLYKVALTLLPDIGDVRAKNLIAYCGSVEAVFKEKESALRKIPGVGEVIAKQISKSDVMERAEEELKFIQAEKISPIFYLDEDYPKRLKHCEDSPVMIYYKGNADLNASKVVCIVGSRAATEYGKDMCAKIVDELADLHVMIVSGLAYGIDVCAHKAALKNDLETIGVLAHGLDMIYPSTHTNIADKMSKQGGLLTEFPSLTKMHPDLFPKRNRIVAGLCDAVIVVEAAEKSGSLITAGLANGYNRDVFAVPGRNGDTQSEGCNNLIKTNRAALLQSAKDITYLLGWEENEKKPKHIQTEIFIGFNADEQVLVNIIQEKGKINIDELSLLAEFTMSKTASVLLNLEFSGIIKSLPGKVYQLH